ncbi:MFS transporter [Actinomadura welshii]
MKLLEPLRQRGFRRLYTGQVVADTGDGLDFLAIMTIVLFEWHHGAGALSLLALCSAVPLVVAAPLFGEIADRYEPRSVMAASNVLRAAAITGIAFSDDLAVMGALAAVIALGGGAYRASQHRYVRYQLSREMLLQANSLRSTTERLLTGLAGPALAGLSITLVGAHATLYITAGCFAVSAVILGAVGEITREDGPRKPRQKGQMSAGFRYVLSNAPLRLTMASMAIAYVLSMMFDVLLPIWYRDMGGGPGYIGLAMMCLGIGGAAGAITVGKIGDRYNLLTVMAAASVAIGAVVGVMGLAGMSGVTELLVIWLFCAAVIGVGSSAAIVGYITLVQRLTPKELMGRVAAVSGMAMTVPTVIGPALAPGASAVAGVSGVFAGCGLALVALGLFIVWRARSYDLSAAPVSAPEPAKVS